MQKYRNHIPIDAIKDSIALNQSGKPVTNLQARNEIGGLQ
jgi:hypothetical protein